MADIHGTLTNITLRTVGDSFDTAASSGAQTLSLYDVSDFDEDGGYVSINGVVYAYDTVDMDADTIHLTSPLTSATAVDDDVTLWDNDNSVIVSERVALIAVDGQEDGDSVSAEIDYSITPLLAQQTLAAGQSVTLTRDGSGFRLTAVHGKTDKGTTISGAATHYSGAGAPSLSAYAGDFYFRTDDPTTANHRIYVNTADGNNWTGIA